MSRFTLAELPNVADQLSAAAQSVLPARCLLVALSGIDGSGKGYVSELLAAVLRERGRRVALVHADGWLELPDRRFDPARPAEHFYDHAFRWEDFFAQLVLPLRDQRSIDLTYDEADPTSAAYRRGRFQSGEVDLVLVEAIFLFKRTLRQHFDAALWIDCSFETAFARALARNQEGLSADELRRDYDTIYFPAQRLHFERDDPAGAATFVIAND